MGLASDPKARLREHVSRGMNRAIESGRPLPLGGMPARAVARAMQQRAQTPPVQPSVEPTLGSMFSSTPAKPQYGSGQQTKKEWWP